MQIHFLDSTESSCFTTIVLKHLFSVVWNRFSPVGDLDPFRAEERGHDLGAEAQEDVAALVHLDLKLDKIDFRILRVQSYDF
jgi:hypothetical protein